MTATVIFEEAGLPAWLIGEGKSHQSLVRWKKSMTEQGHDGLLQETHGKGARSNGSQGISLEDKLTKANAHIVYLEENLALVKKLELHERGVKSGTKARK